MRYTEVMKKGFAVCLLLLATVATAWGSDVVVDVEERLGDVRALHGVNNGPMKPMDDTQPRGNMAHFQAAGIPFVRTHDTSFSEAYGGNHVIDITSIFPDFSKKVDDPASYDFTLTDRYLANIRAVGAEPFYRLGQKIEHYEKKYGVMPPKDFKKWARICEHIIRHYNEGWADGYRWNIRYWEIWNEADLDEKTWNTNPRCWGGTEEQFHDFYATAALHLKKCFPELHIGGPALAGNAEWGDRFLTAMAARQVPIDFFSWHIYTTDPARITARADKMKGLMEKHGYGKAESILNEWNYIRDWTTNFGYSVDVIHGVKGAAFTAACMVKGQQAGIDKMMYYDARPETPFNGLFELYRMRPTRVYYSLYAWNRLYALGTQVKAETSDADLYTIAATGKDGHWAVLVVRYNENDNVSAPKAVNVKLQGAAAKAQTVQAYLVDDYYFFSGRSLPVADGTVSVALQPNAVLLIEGC